MFEGEYLNGKRNGKGKEFYYNGKLMFKGEYLNGKKWNGNGYNDNSRIYSLKDGKGFVKEYGHEYCYEDLLIFEGEYINGEKNGKGIEYDDFGRLKFEGEYLNEKNGMERDMIIKVI